MPANRKPKAWNLKPQMTATPELWRGETVVFPFWHGASAIFANSAIYPNSIEGFNYEPDEMGYGYGNTTGQGSPKIVYPSGAFDRSNISDLTIIYWLSSRYDTGLAQDFLGISGNTPNNDDGHRTFMPSSVGGSSLDVRWRLPEAAGNVDITGIPFSDIQENDVIRVACRLGEGTQDAEFFNKTRGSVYTASASTGASITFDEGTFTVGNRDNVSTGNSSPYNFLIVSVHIGSRLTDDELLRNREDPFAMLRPAGF